MNRDKLWTELKFGKSCFSHAGPKACRASGLNGPQRIQTPVEDISVWMCVHYMGVSRAGHIKCVSTGLGGYGYR